jgi:hypothetical protein
MHDVRSITTLAWKSFNVEKHHFPIDKRERDNDWAVALGSAVRKGVNICTGD